MAPPVSPNGGMIDTSPTEGGLYYRDYPNQYGLRAFKRPDGTYGGEMLPKSTGWLGLQQGEGKEHGNIMSEYSIDDAKGSFPTFVPTLDKNEIELLRQGKLTPSIIQKATAWRDSQEAKGESAFLNPKGFDKGGMGGMPTRAPMAPSGGMGGLPPYQTVQSLAQGQPPQAGGMDLMQPPPMPATNDIGTKPLTVASVVQLLKAQGVPQEQWYDTMSEMKPLFDEQNKQELLQLKTQMDATKMANEVYKAVLSGQNIESLIASRAKVAEGKWVTKPVQRGNMMVPVQFNSVTGEEREIPGEMGGGKWNPNAPTAQLTNVPLSAAGQKAKSQLASTGQNVSRIDNKTFNDMGADAEASGTSVLDTKAGFKATTSALTQNEKDLAAIRPYKNMLDTNIDIAKSLSKKVISTSSAYANKSLNWLKQNAGDNPDTAEFLAQMRFVETEAARVLNNPRLSGQLTDSARKEMESVVSGNLPINSLDRVLARIKSDGDNRVKALETENKQLRKSNAKPAAASTTSADDALINKYLN